MLKRRGRLVVLDSDDEEEIVADVAGHQAKRLYRDSKEGNGILTSATSDSLISLGTSRSPPIAILDKDVLSVASSTKTLRRRELHHVAISGPAFPLSMYEGNRAPRPVVSEGEAIDTLLKALEPQSNDPSGHNFVKLDDFSIYRRESASHAFELISLDRLSQDRFPEFCFDGRLSVGDENYLVRGVRFSTLTVDGYGDYEATDMAHQLCIQSAKALRANVWYQLGAPAKEYYRFYSPFLWLARFTKHFVEFLFDTETVSLAHFRRGFHKWLRRHYSDQTFLTWLAEGRLEDFRTTVAAHVGFLRKECHSLDDDENHLLSHPLWTEIDPNGLKAIPRQPSIESKTVVTPFVYHCFKDMYFGETLVSREISDQDTLAKLGARKQTLRLTPSHKFQPTQPDASRLALASEPGSLPVAVKAGDVVSVRPDTSTRWGTAMQIWLAYVQAAHTFADHTLLDVLWLYAPPDTTLGNAQFPYSNELFLSDNCSCGKDAIDLECVISTVQVAWFSFKLQAREYFVRSKFRTVHDQDTYDFVSLQDSDFACQCENTVSIFEECRSQYQIGDTILAREWSPKLGEDRLQPAQIVDFDTVNRKVTLRRFLRRSEQDPLSGARPNELIPTPEIFHKTSEKIIRKCHVRYFTRQQISTGDIVTPYDRDGTGDFFYLAQEDEVNDELPSINQGWDPYTSNAKPKLIGMGVFCGGGNFDRGLEEGGAVSFRYAIDWAEAALHSYRGNTRNPDKMKFFLGSVNDYLAQAMTGGWKLTDFVAGPGDVNLLAGGSPCPGFSTLQMSKLSDESKQNASMVASIVSFVDFYSPEYFIFENVASMTRGLGPDKDQNVFSQIVATLVALGYQVQQTLTDAWCYGSSQHRTRVFISASAPGLPPLPPQPHSHAHPPALSISTNALGISSNGMPFGSRREEYTTFPHVSASQAVADLPKIGDSQPQLCIPFPDHRTALDQSSHSRSRIAVVPTRPRGMGIIQARITERPSPLPPLLTGEPRSYCDAVGAVRRHPRSRMYARLHPDRLFPTLVTKLCVHDGMNGRVLHWDQHRTLTILEARRAQGFLDGEVVVGTPTQRLKIVGNSVDRRVALVLGLALREAWMGDGRGGGDTATATTVLEGGMGDILTLDDDDGTVKITLRLDSKEREEVRRDGLQAIRRILNERVR